MYHEINLTILASCVLDVSNQKESIVSLVCTNRKFDIYNSVSAAASAKPFCRSTLFQILI